MTTLGLVGYGCSGVLTIDGTLLNCAAWDITDLTPLWANFEIRGDDRVLPGVPGVIAYRRRMTVTAYSLNMFISGDVDRTGAPYGDAWEGLEANVEYLRSHVAQPTNVGDGTRAGVLTMPSGATRTADVHVLGITTGEVSAAGSKHALLRATLELSVPAGRFA